MGDFGAKTKYENIANAGDYQFADPTGNFGQTYNDLRGAGQQAMGQYFNSMQGPAGGDWFGDFMGATGQMTNLAQGATSPLQQSLNQVAQQQANQALQTQAQNFSGNNALYSGAAANAMGEAMANPFAQAQAQTQGALTNMAGNMYNQGMGLFADQRNIDLQNRAQLGNMAQGMMGQQAGMANQTGSMVAPQYVEQQSGWDRFWGDVGAPLNTAAAAGGTFANYTLGGGGQGPLTGTSGAGSRGTPASATPEQWLYG